MSKLEKGEGHKTRWKQTQGRICSWLEPENMASGTYVRESGQHSRIQGIEARAINCCGVMVMRTKEEGEIENRPPRASLLLPLIPLPHREGAKPTCHAASIGARIFIPPWGKNVIKTKTLPSPVPSLHPPPPPGRQLGAATP